MAQPGGFIPPSSYLPSPAPSNFSSTASRSSGLLPNQRSTPLKSGSTPETKFINYVDNALLEISRKFTKKFPTEEEKTNTASNSNASNANGGDSKVIIGYSDVEPLIEDLERIIGLVWVSGTASLQIAYLLQIASSLIQYLPPFPPRPTPTFRLFNKLDLAFHTLISDYRLSGTEKVRLNSIVKVSRAMVIRLMEGRDFLDEPEATTEQDSDSEEDDSDSDSDMVIKEEDEDDDDDMQVDEDTEGDASRLQRKYGRPTKKEVDRTERVVKEEEEEEEWEIEVARVYSRVLEDIGGDIGGDPIGIIVDE
ncbi:hypothetical protein TWF694_009749 [Orbilia ellipsospora]|uniref:Uncharacterized protein n=1 Tax=Orbilia ellipsospora TaxID=2528407 RepID=A0AAV9XC96_9PEZI